MRRIRFQFDPEKSAQAAAYLLKKAGGGMSKYVLLKMLYLADREALGKWGQPITGDEPVSTEFGPVPSRIYDLTKGGVRHAEIWSPVVETKGAKKALLRADPGRDDLSDSELEILEGIWMRFGKYDFKQMKAYCRDLPEYDGTIGKGSRPIKFETLLGHLGKSEDEIRRIAQREREDVFCRTLSGHDAPRGYV
jgi:uncharacterized phage-associated protein